HEFTRSFAQAFSQLFSQSVTQSSQQPRSVNSAGLSGHTPTGFNLPPDLQLSPELKAQLSQLLAGTEQGLARPTGLSQSAEMQLLGLREGARGQSVGGLAGGQTAGQQGFEGFAQQLWQRMQQASGALGYSS